MGSDERSKRFSLRPKLLTGTLLSAALTVLIVSAPEDALAFRAMGGGGFHPSFATHYVKPVGGNFARRASLGRGVRYANAGYTNAGLNGRTGFNRVGRGETGRTGRGETGGNGYGNGGNGRVVVANGGGDHPIGHNNPRWPTWPHRWPLPEGPAVVSTGVPAVVPLTPSLSSLPPNQGGGGLPPGGPQAPAVRRIGSGVPPANENRYVPDEVVVEVATSMTAQQTNALGQRFRLAQLQSVNFPLGGTTLIRWRIPDRRSVPAVVRALETDATVLSAQPNYLFGLQDDGAAAPSEGDPAQYILEKMHLPQAHELARGGKVLVAVIDSGIDVANPDLAGDIADSFDAIGAAVGVKVHPHGTAIAGAIAAHGRLMGAAPAARILAVRAFSGTGADEGTTFAVMTGLDWAVQHGARIVNMSFAGPLDPGIARSLAAAHDRGVVLVAAAGNKGAKSPPLFPAADRNVIAVTSTDLHDQLPAFANRGSYVSVAAPGVDLMLLAPNGSLQFSSGTSFSAAYVTGTAALMLERKPSLTPDTLRVALTASAHHLGDKPVDGQAGGGLVDAYQAILAVAPQVDEAVVTPAADPR